MIRCCFGCTLPLVAVICLGVTGLLTFILGLAILAMSESIVQGKLHDSLAIVPGSPLYLNWAKVPAPLQNRYYFFNVKNKDEVMADGKFDATKAKFEEVGPFLYYDNHVKHNATMTWNTINDTVTYEQTRTYHAKDKSSSLDQEITTISPPYSALNHARLMLQGVKEPGRAEDGPGVAGAVLSCLESKVSDYFVTTTARQFLFDGYDLGWVETAKKKGCIAVVQEGFVEKGLDQPWSMFGDKNQTTELDGLLNMQTGNKDMTKIGNVERWNNEEYIKHRLALVKYGEDKKYQDRDQEEKECGKVTGAADYFPPNLDKSPLTFFATDLCRPMPLVFSHEEELRGFNTYAYKVPKEFFERPNETSTNWCYRSWTPGMKGTNMPGGIFDSSACRSSAAPIFMSKPHFMDASNHYRMQFENENMFSPVEKKHETVFHLEPVSGLPVQIVARFQLNFAINVDENSDYEFIKNVKVKKTHKRVIFPVMWVEQRVEPPDNVLNEIWLIQSLPTVATGAGVAMLIVSFAVLGILLCHFWNVFSAKK